MIDAKDINNLYHTTSHRTTHIAYHVYIVQISFAPFLRPMWGLSESPCVRAAASQAAKRRDSVTGAIDVARARRALVAEALKKAASDAKVRGPQVSRFHWLLWPAQQWLMCICA